MRSPSTESTQLILAISTAAADPCHPERCPSMTVDPIVGSRCERCSQVGERPLTLPVGANGEHPGRCPQHDDRPVDDPSEVMARGAARVTTCVAGLPVVVTTKDGWPPCRRSGTKRSRSHWPSDKSHPRLDLRQTDWFGVAETCMAGWFGRRGSRRAGVLGLPPEWLNQPSQPSGAPSQSRMVVALLGGAGLCVRDR